MNRPAAIQYWSEKLANKLPSNAAEIIAVWIVDLNVDFVISKPRKTKLGDFRPKHAGKPARITVNSDLNPYSFLVTTIHEFAHLGCFLKHKNNVAPHGAEWKAVYKELLNNYATRNPLPEDLTRAIKLHLNNPSASSCSCQILSNALRKYDKDPGIVLHEIPNNSHFMFQNVEYKILAKRRTRYLCERISDRKKYLISGQAKVGEIPA